MSHVQGLVDVFTMATSVNPPSGEVGIDLKLLPGGLKPSLYLITVVVVDVATDIDAWILIADGVSGDESDDQWGLFTDKYDRVVSGRLATALAAGTHHFVVEDLGGAHRLYFVRGTAGTQSTLDLATVSVDADSVIGALADGAAGNAVTISFVADGVGAGTLEESGTASVFHFQDGVTTVADFETAIAGSILLEVVTPGTGANILVAVDDEFAATNLAGGVGGAFAYVRPFQFGARG